MATTKTNRRTEHENTVQKAIENPKEITRDVGRLSDRLRPRQSGLHRAGLHWRGLCPGLEAEALVVGRSYRGSAGMTGIRSHRPAAFVEESAPMTKPIRAAQWQHAIVMLSYTVVAVLVVACLYSA